MAARKSGTTTRRRTSARQKKPTTIDLEAKKDQAADSKTAAPAAASAKPADAPKTSSQKTQTNPKMGRAGAQTSDKKPEPAKTANKEKKSGTGMVPLIAAGLIGAVGATALSSGLQYSGLLGAVHNQTSEINEVGVSKEDFAKLEEKVSSFDTASTDSKLAGLEAAIDQLKNASSTSGTIDDARLAEIEKSVAGLESSLKDLSNIQTGEPADSVQLTTAISNAKQRIEKIEGTMSEFLASGNEGLAASDERISALSNKLDETNTSSEEKINSLVSSISGIESSLEKLQEQVFSNKDNFDSISAVSSDLKETIASVKASEKIARSVALNALGSALENDDPILLPITSLESLGGKTEETVRLAELANAGIPSLTDLKSDLESFTNTVQNPVVKPEGETVTEKFWASARSLVTFRSSGPQEGNSSVAILSRVKSKLELGQLSLALAEWKSLPLEVRGTGKDFSSKLEQRIEAFETFGRLSDKLNQEAS